MENNPTIRIVVAAALISSGKDVLMQRCAQDHAHAGQWEFPGGKVEPGETPEAALCRELEEELGIAVAARDLVPLAFSADPDQSVNRSPYVILLYTCHRWQGEPSAQEAAEIGWIAPGRLDSLPLPPLDRPLARRLRETS